MAAARSMTAREGRENQLYSANGCRLVAGTVVVSDDRSKVLIISSEAKPHKWVLPKGGVEKDEKSFEEAALRETWEEAGAIGRIVRSLGVIEDHRTGRMADSGNGTWPPKSEFHFFEMKFESLEPKWPEAYKRRRKWVSWAEAKAEMERNNRPELREALERAENL